MQKSTHISERGLDSKQCLNCRIDMLIMVKTKAHSLNNLVRQIHVQVNNCNNEHDELLTCIIFIELHSTHGKYHWNMLKSVICNDIYTSNYKLNYKLLVLHTCIQFLSCFIAMSSWTMWTLSSYYMYYLTHTEPLPQLPGYHNYTLPLTCSRCNDKNILIGHVGRL